MNMALSPTAYWRGQVDERLDGHDDAINRHTKEFRDVHDDIEVLQRFMWKTLGAAMIGSILGGCLTTVVAYLIIGALHHP